MTTINKPSKDALAGMKVIELAQIMAGPTCGMMLADLGAEVIKVEKINGGDDSRQYSDPQINGISAPFLMLNRNKQAIALDLKSEKGKEILFKLIKDADVLTENFRKGTMEKLGIGYDTLRKINPGLIYCSISGYGSEGPYADKGGFDLIAQGFSGLMSITGEPNGAPLRTGNSIADINAGILAAFGILAAYQHKQRTGEGQRVETSLLEASLQQLYWHAAIYFATGESPGPSGSSHILATPYQAFPTGSDWIIIGGANEKNWVRIAQVLGHAEWTEDERFKTNSARMANKPALITMMTEILATRPAAQWLAEFDKAGVPAGPVNNIGQALMHPQSLAMGMVVEQEHPVAGAIRTVGMPVKFSKTQPRYHRPPPRIGEDTIQILQGLGYTSSEIDELIQTGTITCVSGNSAQQPAATSQ
ncbi:crotonobetainyl-CoA:carnitine CoA-transferase CaiB-like acyl-CoA transferase [Advenella incenata]|jgi:crotonobetainyl-CoA:carnitine CoA-transferase CaiB-like acyl-CoA transferase|uniref:Crotonobetainyl-CoA:carnitine CoA-transferase CaiB-like acyl-CoA transferase n=1 Tax=Advenella incenata TaxID=267800 RepID=A0A4Q7VPM1_9BURK|nr:CoA transferase [Advenella incenata]RZT98371.1 crotonobetainyl-CoA:carnitine CoA-transferase CaiB-like acyl-CoA transferase [Advenella incenata]